MYLKKFVIRRRIAENKSDPKNWECIRQDRCVMVIRHKKTRRIDFIDIYPDGTPYHEQQKTYKKLGRRVY